MLEASALQAQLQAMQAAALQAGNKQASSGGGATPSEVSATLSEEVQVGPCWRAIGAALAGGCQLPSLNPLPLPASRAAGPSVGDRQPRVQAGGARLRGGGSGAPPARQLRRQRILFRHPGGAAGAGPPTVRRRPSQAAPCAPATLPTMRAPLRPACCPPPQAHLAVQQQRLQDKMSGQVRQAALPRAQQPDMPAVMWLCCEAALNLTYACPPCLSPGTGARGGDCGGGRHRQAPCGAAGHQGRAAGAVGQGGTTAGPPAAPVRRRLPAEARGASSAPAAQSAGVPCRSALGCPVRTSSGCCARAAPRCRPRLRPLMAPAQVGALLRGLAVGPARARISEVHSMTAHHASVAGASLPPLQLPPPASSACHATPTCSPSCLPPPAAAPLARAARAQRRARARARLPTFATHSCPRPRLRATPRSPGRRQP